MKKSTIVKFSDIAKHPNLSLSVKDYLPKEVSNEDSEAEVTETRIHDSKRP